MRILQTGVLAASAALLCLAGPSLAEERVVLDFSEQMPGDSLPTSIGEAHLMHLHNPSIEFLTADTTPPTPFPDGVHGLKVDQGDSSEARVRLRIKPFSASQTPKVGWVELEMVVNSPQHNGADIGSGGLSGVASSVNPVYDGKVILGLNLNTDRPVEVTTFPEDSRKIVHRGSPSPELGVPFRLRIAWDFSGEAPIVKLSINGEVLQDPTGSELILEIPGEEAADGVDYFSFMLRNAILGRIFASE